MEKNIVMPRLRPEMEKGVLCAWLKEEGEPVSAGEPLFEIETDKVVNQIEATQDGVLKKQLIEEGDTVDVKRRWPFWKRSEGRHGEKTRLAESPL